MPPPLAPADVLFAGSLSAEEASELVDAFREVGLAADLHKVAPRRSLEDLAWLALVAVPLKPFLDELLKNVAGDSYKQLKSLTSKILHRQIPATAEQAHVLLLQDAATGIQVVIEPDLPDKGYQQLMDFDFTSISRGPLHYDRHLQRWRSELDEATPALSSP
jgi:hypothetical protein